ncbi:MAG: hypothetical protein LLG20_12580 [Acidobacteriales bacterium]|nr:hypothetical protein [Terriglobales bacterium]
MKDLPLIRAILVCCVCAMLTHGALCGQMKATSLIARDPRPLAEMASQLERLSGVPINFEDARYENASDVEDVTESVVKPEHRALNKTGSPFRVLIPRGGELSLSLEVDAVTDRLADPYAALVSALNAHKVNGFPGLYVVNRDNGAFTISPEEVRGTGGSMIPVKSILETSVTFAPVPRTAADTLRLVLDDVSRTSGFRIDVGMIPLNGFISRTVALGAQGESARNVLARLFADVASTKTPIGEPVTVLSYRLLFDPGLRSYAFNIHVVRPFTQTVVAAPATRSRTTADRFFTPTVKH